MAAIIEMKVNQPATNRKEMMLFFVSLLMLELFNGFENIFVGFDFDS